MRCERNTNTHQANPSTLRGNVLLVIFQMCENQMKNKSEIGKTERTTAPKIWKTNWFEYKKMKTKPQLERERLE